MTNFPAEIRINLLRQPRSGLIAAVSPELPGLMTVATTIEEIERRLPDSIAQLVKAQYGADVSVSLEVDDGGDDFLPLSEPRVAELHAA